MKCAAPALLLLLLACVEPEPLALQVHENTPRLEAVHTTLYSNLREPQRLIIRDSETWARLWPQMTSAGDPRTPPFVDFSTDDVIVAAMGERRAAGYSIAITDVQPLGPETRIVVTSSVPGPTCTRAEIMTAPVHAVRVRRITGAVTFQERGAVLGCE